MKSATTDLTGTAELAQLRRQRDLARVCAVLVTVVMGIVLWNNFGRDFPGLKDAQELVLTHRALLSENQKNLETVNAALRANQQEADRLAQVKRKSP